VTRTTRKFWPVIRGQRLSEVKVFQLTETTALTYLTLTNQHAFTHDK